MEKAKPIEAKVPRVSLNLMYVPTITKGLEKGDVYKKEDGTLMIVQ